MDATLLLTADRNLRRIYGNPQAGVLGTPPNIAGLTAFANALAQDAAANPATIISATSEGGSGAGVITMPREVWLLAAENLLADPIFVSGGSSQRPPRVVIPDYRFAQPV